MSIYLFLALSSSSMSPGDRVGYCVGEEEKEVSPGQRDQRKGDAPGERRGAFAGHLQCVEPTVRAAPRIPGEGRDGENPSATAGACLY